MREEQAAKRYYVSGTVQGVGFRYFARRVAMRMGLAGYVRNLRDGRVEVYAVGLSSQLQAFRTELERGPHGSSVSSVSEEVTTSEPHFAEGFSIEDDI